MAKSTKGLTICITKGTATPSALTPTAITAAKPAVVSVAAVTDMVAGDVVTLTDTGFVELDGKSWIVGTVDDTGHTFELLGSDTTGSTATLGTTPKASHYLASDMVCLCLSSLTFNADEAGVISTATYCSPSSSVPSAVVAAGSLSFGGYVDIASVDYAELLLAAEDGIERVVRIMLPGNGYLIAPVTFSSIAWDLPLDGAISYTGSAVLASRMQHLF